MFNSCENDYFIAYRTFCIATPLSELCSNVKLTYKEPLQFEMKPRAEIYINRIKER